MFKKYDKDKSGTIEVKELMQVLKAINFDLSGEQSHPIPSHPIPSHPVPSQSGPIQSGPLQSNPISSSPVRPCQVSSLVSISRCFLRP